MSTLILDRSNLAMRQEGAVLALYENGTRRGTVPMKLLERVVVQGSSFEFTSGAMLRLAEHGASVLFLSPRQSRQLAIVLGPGHNDAAVRLAQFRLVSDAEARQRWSQDLVRRKLRRQSALLRHLCEARRDCRKALTAGRRSIERIERSLTGSDVTIEALRGSEGAAAAQYFKALASVFPPGLGFAGRNRRPPRDPVNACLSLAYTLLHFDAVRAAHTAGLDPLLGLYHRPAFGRESLACDLIEPLRPRIDRWIWRLLADRTLRTEHFNADKGACLLSKTGRGHFYPAWDSFAGLHRRHLRRQCSLLARHLRADGERLLEAIPGFDDDEVTPP